MKLTATNVHTLVKACLYADSEIENGAVKAGVPAPIAIQSIRINLGFHPERIELHKPDIAAMLKELPAG